jgi:hypothetical protein
MQNSGNMELLPIYRQVVNKVKNCPTVHTCYLVLYLPTFSVFQNMTPLSEVQTRTKYKNYDLDE